MLHVIRKYQSIILYIRFLFLIPVLFFLTGAAIQAESVSDTLKTIQKKYKRQAQVDELQGAVYEAIDNYNNYFQFGGTDPKTAYKLANLYFITRNYSNARSFYDSALIKKPRKYPLAYYRKGIVCMNLEEYQQAVESLEVFRKQFRSKTDRDQLRRQAYSLIESARWALLHKDSVADITVINVGRSVNQPHIEFSPYPVNGNTFLYGSLVEDTINPGTGKRQLYKAERKGGRWESTGKLPKPINDPKYHTGNAALSVDGQRLYFTRCRKNWRDKQICEIFMSELVNDEWQEPVKLPFPINDENYTSTQPALGQYVRNEADILYFISDRPGSRGGLDIWYSVFDKHEGVFKKPRNAGSKINTRGNECCPFYDKKNRTLYFSSDLREGFGGYDIYKSTGSTGKWTDATHLPKPINSSYDDTYFSVIPNTEEGFFTSNRPGSYTMENGSCCDDIFFYSYNECTRVQLKGKVVNVTNRDIYDELNTRYGLNLPYPKDSTPAQNIPVQLYLIHKDTTEEILVSQSTTNEQGEYHFGLDINKDYKLVVKNYGFFDKVRKLSTKGVKCSDTIDAGISRINVLPEITVRFNVYYEHDKSRLTKEARATIDTLLLPVFDLFPNAIIEIGSHTDNTGSDSYNDKLSQRRSESVVNYLIQKGISADRLVAHGYGESMPIAPNTNPDGSDNPEGRQLNRRTEMRIIGEISTFYLDE